MVELSSWFLDGPLGPSQAYILRGIVHGHPRVPDGQFIHTSEIEDLVPVDGEGQRYLARTQNTNYTLDAAQCDAPRCLAFLAWLGGDEELPPWLARWKAEFTSAVASPPESEPSTPAPPLDLALWRIESINAQLCLCGLVREHPRLIEGSELPPCPISSVSSRGGGVFWIRTVAGECFHVSPADLDHRHHAQTLGHLRAFGVDTPELEQEALLVRQAREREAAQLARGELLCAFLGQSFLYGHYKAADGSLCPVSLSICAQPEGEHLNLTAGDSELLFLRRPFSPLRCERWPSPVTKLGVRNDGRHPLLLEIGTQQFRCPRQAVTWIPRFALPVPTQQRLDDHQKEEPMELLGQFPDTLSPELAERARAMLRQVYQAGGFRALRPLDEHPDLSVLVSWDGQDHVVLPDRNTTVPVYSSGKNGRLDGWIYGTPALRESGQTRTTQTLEAACLLCEHLFPGQIYARADLKAPSAQKGLRFLKGLFPEEDFDALLTGRMDKESLWRAVKASPAPDPGRIYELLALTPEPDILLESMEVFRAQIEAPRNDAELLAPDTLTMLDQRHPHTTNNQESLTLFLLYLRKVLLERFDFSHHKRESVIQAAMFLNRIRNGGGAAPADLPEFPPQILLRLFTVEWEVLVQVLAFLAELPAEEVRSMTAHTVLRRGEEARAHLNQALRRSQLEAIRDACRAPLDQADYFGRRPTDHQFASFVRGMQRSARCCSEHGPNRDAACLEILRSLGENGLYLPEELYRQIMSAHWGDRFYFAALCAVEVLARRRDGSWDRERALALLREMERMGRERRSSERRHES